MCADPLASLLRSWTSFQQPDMDSDADSTALGSGAVSKVWAATDEKVPASNIDGADRELSDTCLLEAISNGDRDRWALLFRRYAQLVRSVALRILRDPAEADDLVQEVFLFVFRRAALFDPSRGSARSWLIQITYHRAFDRRRYLASRRMYANLELNEAILRSEEPAVLSSFYDDTIEAALGRDVLRRIEESLSPIQRRVMRLHFVEGYTVEEIAGILGQSQGNVRNHFYRALEKMRREVFAAKLQAK